MLVSIDGSVIVAVLIGRSTSFSSFQSQTSHKKSEIFKGASLPASPSRVFQFSPFTLLPDKIANGGYDLTVSASEIIQELPKLSDAERQAVLDKLRELAQVDDDRWEEIINEPTPRPKLQAFIEQATAEGSEPLDLNRM